MKSVLLRLLLTLTLTFGFSTISLSAQDDEKKKEQNENQRGQRGQGGGQRGQGGGQRPGGLGDMSEMSKEERVAHLNKLINTNVVQMIDAAQVREDQQEAFVKAQAKYEIELIKVLGQMQSVGRDRDKRQRLMQTRAKATTAVAKEVKKVLDKDQFKLYQAKMEERTPQQRGRGGRGR
ncbi:MAG: hypothetical protein P8L44_20350 [Opitutales bacterium]|jgi:hypothetical protein|nr:hypothetical protein [bacterium]MDG2170267.1 hypothetical protein [Opitutales bacterium]